MSDIYVGDRVRIAGLDNLTGTVNRVQNGNYLWIDVHGQSAAWMLPRAALEVIPPPPPPTLTFPDEGTAAWHALVSEVYHAISDEAATAKSITRAVRNHLANEASNPRTTP